jgi:hypothetical protein
MKLHEKVLPRYLQTLVELIRSDGIIKNPIIIDRDTGTVLDGSHRYVALLLLKCVAAPTISVNYYGPSVDVGSRRSHRFRVNKPIAMSKGVVLYSALSGNLMPPRSSRHFFKFYKLVRCDVELKELRNVPHLAVKPDIDVSKFIADYTLEEELKDLSLYIEECNEDLVNISDLENEVVTIRNDLFNRYNILKEMKND